MTKRETRAERRIRAIRHEWWPPVAAEMLHSLDFKGGYTRDRAATEALESLSQEQVADLAWLWISLDLDARIRDRALAVERQAIPVVPATWTPPPARRRSPQEIEAQWEKQNNQDIERYLRLHDAMQRHLEIYTAEMRAEWTSDLLGTEFALGDGTSTTWGAATAEQHLMRAAMFERNAAGNIEGAARHHLAAREIRAAHARCLNEIVESFRDTPAKEET